MEGDRKCIVCGKRYHFCIHDVESKNKPQWMVIYCSEKCRAMSKAKIKMQEEKNGIR